MTHVSHKRYKGYQCGKKKINLHLTKKWHVKLFIPSLIISGKTFVYYSNQTLIIIADKILACLYWYFRPFIFCNDFLVFEVRRLPCHHPNLQLPPWILYWIQVGFIRFVFLSANHLFTTFSVCFAVFYDTF